MTRREFTRTQKALIIKRAMDAKGNIFCEGCGLNITGKAVEIDHTTPEAMLLPEDRAKPLTIEDGKALGRDCCHALKTYGKTGDIAMVAKAKRREANDLGIKSKIKGKGFPPARRNGAASRPLMKQLPPRRLI